MAEGKVEVDENETNDFVPSVVRLLQSQRLLNVDRRNSYEDDNLEIVRLREAVHLTKGKITELQTNLDSKEKEVQQQLSLRQAAQNRFATLQSYSIDMSLVNSSRNNVNDKKFINTAGKQPPVKPPRRKHSLRNQLSTGSLSTERSRYPSKHSSVQDLRQCHSLDAFHESRDSDSLISSFLTDVKIQNNSNSVNTVASSVHSRRAASSTSISSSDSSTNSSFHYRDNKRQPRRHRRSTGSTPFHHDPSKIKLCSQLPKNVYSMLAPPTSQAVYYASQWPLTLYPVPVSENTSPKHNARQFVPHPVPFSPSSLPSNIMLTPDVTSKQDESRPRITSPELDEKIPADGVGNSHRSKTEMTRKHKRSLSDPLNFNFEEISRVCSDLVVQNKNELDSKQPHFKFPIEKSEQRINGNANKYTANLGKHSSKFAALLEEIYTAQKERDEAMTLRLKQVQKDRDETAAYLTEAQCIENSPSRINSFDENLDSQEKGISQSLDLIEKSQSVSQMQRYTEKLLSDIQKAKQNKNQDVLNYIDKVISERDNAIKKVTELLNECEQYQTAIDTSAGSVETADTTRSSNDVYGDNEMMRLCYSLHKSLVQDANIHSVSTSEYGKDTSAPNNSIPSDLLNELQEVHADLKAERQARLNAEKKCEKLQMAVNMMRQKVNKMNGFDPFHRSLSSSIENF